MNSLLHLLEILARYGIIDIFFGVGIIQYIRLRLKKTTVTKLDGIEIVRRFHDNGFFEIEIINCSMNPLYIYRSYFDPYYNKMIGTNLEYFYMHWVRELPPISLKEGTPLNRNYMLHAYDQNDTPIPTVFLENRNRVFYRLNLENGPELVKIEKDNLLRMLNESKCGTLTLHCVHGTNQVILSTRV